MLELVSGMLRQVLHGEPRQEVTLDDELRFIERYLAIEQVRFGDRLRVEWSIEEHVRGALLPEFILQPLVENAIRHGVAKRSDAGAIEIGASAAAHTLVFVVSDDGSGPDADGATVEGIGLANTRARLETMYGDAGTLELDGGVDTGTSATIRIPMRRAADA
jgi:LytS/YehU family sensor histidine kinase